MEVSGLEKRIYNQHLASTQSGRGKPFTLKKDFSNLTDTQLYQLKRLSTFFQKFPNIDLREYFDAPYQLYPDAPYYDLAYYASPKGIKAYTTWKKQKDSHFWNQPEEAIKKSFKFIAQYCEENQLTLDGYWNSSSDIPIWLIHAKEGKISFIVLFAVPQLIEALNTIGPELTEFYLGDFGLNIHQHKINFIQTPTLQHYIQKITQIINNHLTNTKNNLN